MYPPFPAAWHKTIRPCITFPAPPLKFRTSGFPQYGFKLEFNHDLQSARDGLSARPAYAHRSPPYTWPKLPTRKRDIPQRIRWAVRSGAYAQSDLTSSFRSNPVQRPLALQRVMLSRQVSAYYGLIRHSRLLPPAYFLRPGGSLPDGLVWAGTERLPNLLRMSLSSVPPSVPRRTERVLVTIPSPLMLVLRLFRRGSTSAHPRTSVPAWSCNEAAKFASCYGPVELLALHRQGRLLPSLHPSESPPRSVGYSYAGKRPIPAAGLAPARHAALWAANGIHGKPTSPQEYCVPHPTPLLIRRLIKGGVMGKQKSPRVGLGSVGSVDSVAILAAGERGS